MGKFRVDNIRQQAFINVDYLEVIGTNTFEYSLYRLLEREGILNAFIRQYKNDHSGRKAYPPAVLLRVIFFAYYRGITSSRVIASLCKTDLKFMALAGGECPHFTTIANFVSAYPEAIADVFHKVILVCDESGLIGKEHFAIDGCKLPSDASKQWSGTHEELEKKAKKMFEAAKKIIAKHQANDGKPVENPNKEREQQSIVTLLGNAEKILAFLSENEPRMGQGAYPKEVQSNITDPDSAKMLTGYGAYQGFVAVTAADEKHQVIVNAEAWGMGQEQSTLVPTIEGIENNLGIDLSKSGTVVTADTGYSSEANMKYVFEKGVDAVIPDNQFRKRDPLFVNSETYNTHKEKRKKTRKDRAKKVKVFSAAEFKVNLKTNTCVCPAGKEMMYHGQHEDEVRGTYSRFRGKLKDCRNCKLSARCMKNKVTKRGRQILIRNEAKKRTSNIDLMKQKVDSEEGRLQYSKRMWTIEPVFGNIKSNKGLDRFSLRGKAKVTGQWLLYCLVHNMEKLWRYGPEMKAV